MEKVLERLYTIILILFKIYLHLQKILRTRVNLMWKRETATVESQVEDEGIKPDRLTGNDDDDELINDDVLPNTTTPKVPTRQRWIFHSNLCNCVL